MDSQPDTLRQAIDQLSSKKHVLRTGAEASTSSDSRKASDTAVNLDSKQVILLEELKQSVNLLSTLFQASRFDAFLFMLAKPFRLFVLSFLMAFLKGIGFALGILLVLLMVVLYFFPHLISLYVS